MKILIVEDEPDLRTLLALSLEGFGYEVGQASDGEEGLKVAGEMRPDLVISDLFMPKKDGNEFLKQLRQTDFGRDTPFIILTARAEARAALEGADVADIIEKPFKMDDVLARVQKALGGGVQEAP